MTYDMNNLFGDLDQKDFGSSPEVAAKQEAAAPKFPCMSCAGTGLFKGVRVHQEESKCFACAGKGYHKKDHFEAMKDKAARKAKAEGTRAHNLLAFRDRLNAEQPGLLHAIEEHATWNNFCRSLIPEISAGKYPSARAIEIVRDIDAKSKARAAARQAERDAVAVELNYQAIHDMFDHAKKSGLSRMSYRAEGFKMTPAKSSGRNPGAIYIKRDNGADAYVGKVINGKLHAGHAVTPDDVAKLQVIAANPLEAAKAYGKFTGKCSCCGRALTDHVSIELGIGPICAQKWGFMGSDDVPSVQADAMRKAGRAKQKQAMTDAIEATKPEIVDEINFPRSVASKYDAFYTTDMTAAQKKALRARLRKGQS